MGRPSLHTLGMQGRSDPNRELLDAAALCRQLVPEGTVEAFLADHRQELFPDELFEDLFPSGRGRPSVPADRSAQCDNWQDRAAQIRRSRAATQTFFARKRFQRTRESPGAPMQVWVS